MPRLLAFLAIGLPLSLHSFVPTFSLNRHNTLIQASSSDDDDESINVQINEFFKKPVPAPIKDYLAVRQESPPLQQDFDFLDIVKAPPGSPGIPRPLWSVILASIPTGIVWYGYYKFAIEEELLNMELKAGKEPRGFGGYGTLGPFSYGLVLGPIAAILHLPGGINWATAGIVFIYYTQFLLYDRVNELYREEGLEDSYGMVVLAHFLSLQSHCWITASALSFAVLLPKTWYRDSTQ